MPSGCIFGLIIIDLRNRHGFFYLNKIKAYILINIQIRFDLQQTMTH